MVATLRPVTIWKGLIGGALLALSSRLFMQRGWSLSDACTLGLAAAVIVWGWDALAQWASDVEEGFRDEGRSPRAAAAVGDPHHREDGVVYSGDLLLVETDDPVLEDRKLVMQRDEFASEVTFGPPELSNLSKLRLVLPDAHDPLRLRPIHYGDRVHLAHSGFAENRNEAGFVIKRARTLVSHQKGDEFAAFRVLSAQDPTGDVGKPVRGGTDVFLEAVESGGLPSAYVAVRPDHKVDDSPGRDLAKATRFRLRVQRPTEIGDRHLDLAPGEFLFP